MDTLPVPSPSRNIEMEKWTDTNSKTFVLESVPDLFQSDSDDDYLYEEIPIEEFEDDKSDTEDENLEETVRNITERRFFEENEIEIKNIEENKDNVASTTKQPEVVEDYIKNFFYSRGLKKSLETFQEEWYEFKKKGNLSPEDSEIVPDLYVKNQKLADNIQKLRTNIEEYKDIANKAQSTFEKLKKERDYHRMHHQRVVQEKNKLISDIHRLKNKCSMFEPMIEGIQKKYETAMKEKMLTKLDRDRLASKIVSLESTISQLENLIKENEDKNNGRISQNNTHIKNVIYDNTNESMNKNQNQSNQSHPSSSETKKIYPKHSISGQESVLPVGNRQNPYNNVDIAPVNTSQMKLLCNIEAHDAAISCIKLHPKKNILATVSDDKYWKMWAFPSGELIMSGMGHTDWIADCDFHPKGGQLATASGDGTIKIWDFLKGQAIATLSEHTQAVWGCAYHDLGDFIVSGSMDHTAKLWDIQMEKCKHTFRGHSDSVNNIGFQPYTNVMYTCSSDKTICFWDIRTGMVTQTLNGHNNSINHGIFSLKGNSFASCDADGIVKVWDIRSNSSELVTLNYGPSSANKLSFDLSGTILAVASDDGQCKIYNCSINKELKSIKGTDESLQAVLFDQKGEYLITAGSEGSFQIYH